MPKRAPNKAETLLHEFKTPILMGRRFYLPRLGLIPMLHTLPQALDSADLV